MEVYLILWCGSFSQAFTVNRVLEFVMVSKLFDTVDKCFFRLSLRGTFLCSEAWFFRYTCPIKLKSGCL